MPLMSSACADNWRLDPEVSSVRVCGVRAPSVIHGVVLVQACESGSMFEGLLPTDLDIYATTAANAKESSWGTYCPPVRADVEAFCSTPFSTHGVLSFGHVMWLTSLCAP